MSEDLPENCNHGGRLDTEGESTTLFRVREERIAIEATTLFRVRKERKEKKIGMSC